EERQPQAGDREHGRLCAQEPSVSRRVLYRGSATRRCRRPPRVQEGDAVRLEGKVALITGAGSGMGRAAAELFAREGARVVVSDLVDDAGSAAVDAIRASGGDATFVRADVSQWDDCVAMVAAATDTYGALHVLYNNAGIFPADDGGVLDTPEPTWEKVMDVNLKGVWLGCKAGIPAMLASGGGAIVNVASFVALMGAATAQIAYTASKGGVLAMTREL